MGHFRTLPTDGGGGGSPLRSVQTTGLILNPLTAFDSPRQDLSEYIAKFHLKVTDDVTGQVRAEIFDFHLDFAGQNSRIELKESQ